MSGTRPSPEDDLRTTSDARAASMLRMRNEISHVLMRYRYETDITLEEMVGSLEVLRTEMITEWPEGSSR